MFCESTFLALYVAPIVAGVKKTRHNPLEAIVDNTDIFLIQASHSGWSLFFPGAFFYRS